MPCSFFIIDKRTHAHIEPQLGGKDELKSYILKESKYAEFNNESIIDILPLFRL